MNPEPNSSRVLIVGAGPVGLVLACELLQHDIDVHVVSRARSKSPHSRATILWPRILELLDRVGVAEKLVGGGHYFDQMNYYSNKRRIGRIRFDRLRGVGYPFAITIPQWRTEEILEGHLNALGGSVRYDHEFLGGTQTVDGVGCRLRAAGAGEAIRTFDWVVGADGYDSTVRRQFGFDFDGRALRTRLAITDAEIVGEVTSSEAAYYLTRTGNMVLAPLSDGVFRVGASVPEWFRGDDPDRPFFEQLLRERVPGVKELGAMNFSGVFTANVRSSSSFQRGRVFLVGDAAHVMSPSGAQGLNTGIQDAVNLGWKLAGVVRGRYGPELLRSYDAERRPAVEEVARFSTQLARISLYSRRRQTIIRDLAYRLGSATSLLEAALAPRLAQVDTKYDLGPGAHGLTPGERIPLGWRRSYTEPVLAVDRHTVLLWPGLRYCHERWGRTVDHMRQELTEVAVRDLGGRPPGPLLPRLGRSALALVVRPDGHLHAVVDINVDELQRNGANVAQVLSVRPAIHRNHYPGRTGAGLPTANNIEDRSRTAMNDRVTLPQVEAMTLEQTEVYERFQSNLTRALLLTKGSAGPHLALGASFTVGLLNDLQREVIVLRVAKLRDSAFERALHHPLALKAGLTEDEIDAIEQGRLDEMPTDREVLIRYVDDCILLHRASDASFWSLRKHYSENEIAEVTHLAGHAAMTAMYLASLDIPLDTEFASWARLTELQR